MLTVPATRVLPTGVLYWQAFATDSRQWGNGSWERNLTVGQAPEVILHAAGALTSPIP